MAHLIKLESGDYLNLDQVVYIEHGVWMEINDDATVCYMVNGSKPLISPKDLEKIEELSLKTDDDYIDQYKAMIDKLKSGS